MVVLVGAAYLVGIVVLGGDEAREAVAGAGTPALAGAVVLQVVVTLCWPLVHRASLRAVGEDLSYRHALEVAMSAFTVSHTVPGGGAVGAVVAVDRLTRFGVPGVAATAGVALTGPISLTTIAGLGAVGITAATIAGEVPGTFLVVVLVVLAILLAVVATIVTALRSPALGERIIEAVARRSARLRRRAAGWRAAWHGLADAGPSAAQTSAIIGWALVKWGADIASLAVVFVAVGEEPRLTVLLAGFAVSQVLAAVPLTPGAVGVVESGMVGVFVVFGVPAGSAVTIAILYRVVEMWLPTAAGVPMLARGMSR